MTKLQKDVARADKSFSDHEISRQDDSRILIRRKKESCFWTEIILGAQGTLIVHGDGPDLILRSYRHEESLENLIYWVGHSGIDHISSKVVAGKTTEYMPDEAKRDLVQYIKELEEDLEEEEPEGSILEDLKAFVEDTCDGWNNESGVYIDLTNIDPGIYEIFPLGQRPAFNFIMAQAACRKAVALMDAVKEGAA